MEGVRIYEDAELDKALALTGTASSPDAIKKVLVTLRCFYCMDQQLSTSDILQFAS